MQVRKKRLLQSRKSGLLEKNCLVSKPEELTVLTDEWRMYAEAEIPDEWLQDKDGKTV